MQYRSQHEEGRGKEKSMFGDGVGDGEEARGCDGESGWRSAVGSKDPVLVLVSVGVSEKAAMEALKQEEQERKTTHEVEENP